MKKILCIVLTACVAVCALSGMASASGEASRSASPVELTAYGPIDSTRWQYNEANDVYWQVGVSYCAEPADESYENLGIYVPGAYMSAAPNGDGIYLHGE